MFIGPSLIAAFYAEEMTLWLNNIYYYYYYHYLYVWLTILICKGVVKPRTTARTTYVYIKFATLQSDCL